MGLVAAFLRTAKRLLSLLLVGLIAAAVVGGFGPLAGYVPASTDGGVLDPGDGSPFDPGDWTPDSSNDGETVGEDSRTTGGTDGTRASDETSTDDARATSLETTAAPRTSPTANPWRSDTVVVAVEGSGRSDRNDTRLVATALDYWEAHGEYAAYSVEFALRPDADDPDVVVSFTDDVRCSGHTEAVAGCAPILNETYRPSPPETIQIETGHNDRSTLVTLQHEFGHVLGIRHCRRPLAIMGSNCPGGVETDRPDATDRPLPWRSSNLTVYVNDSGVSHPVDDQLDHALDYHERGADGTAPDDLSFTRVDRRSAADVVIRFGDTECASDARSCFSYRGRDIDGDGAMEYFVGSTVVLSPETDRAAVGWHAGYGLGYLLGAEDRTELPPPFVDAGYADRRSVWWR